MMTILLCLEVLVLWGTTKLTACAGAVPLDMVGWCNAPAISRTFTLQLMTTAASLVMLLGAFALAYYKRQATILGAAVTVCSLTLMLLWTVPVWFLN